MFTFRSKARINCIVPSFFYYLCCFSMRMECLLQVRNARPCWQKLPDWGRRGARSQERQQGRKGISIPCSPAEGLSASQRSSCLLRLNLFAPPTANQVYHQGITFFKRSCLVELLCTHLFMYPLRTAKSLLLCPDPLWPVQHCGHAAGHSCWRSEWRHHLLPHCCHTVGCLSYLISSISIPDAVSGVYCIQVLLAFCTWYSRKDIRSSFEIDVEVYSLVSH